MRSTTNIFVHNFEIYTLHPVDGTGGWEIQFPSIYAESREAARKFLKEEYPLFDCVISHNYSIPIEDSKKDLKEYLEGNDYRDTTFADRYN